MGMPTLQVSAFLRDALVYRRWIPPGCGEEYEAPAHFTQSMQKGRLGHKIWSEDLTTYFTSILLARCCEKCQKTTNRKVPLAPLIPRLIITESLKDIIGPCVTTPQGTEET